MAGEVKMLNKMFGENNNSDMQASPAGSEGTLESCLTKRCRSETNEIQHYRKTRPMYLIRHFMAANKNSIRLYFGSNHCRVVNCRIK